MPDLDCQNACVEAYTAQVGNCNDVLRDNLILAKTEDDKQLAQQRFDRCMKLAQETKEICIRTCGDQYETTSADSTSIQLEVTQLKPICE
ncbi:MAG: hypothetical protein ACRYFS_21150 [Janthinobacterium lividum]